VQSTFQTSRKEGPHIPLLCNNTTNTMKLDGVDNVIGQPQHSIGNTRVKMKSSSTHKSFIKAIEKENVALVESINHIHEVNL